MANTFSQIYIQYVFAVKYRESLILPDWEERLYRYITGVVQGKGQKMLAINGMPDHLHLLVGMNPDCRPSELIREVKKASNEFVQENKFVRGKFQWQEGFGAFSYGRSQLSQIIPYIQNQKAHHRKRTFKEEYLGFLKKFEVEFDERFVFQWILDGYAAES